MRNKTNNSLLVFLFTLSIFLFTCTLSPSLSWSQQAEADPPEMELSFEDELAVEDEILEVYDPLEGMNRSIFSFNHFVYEKIFDPVADGYNYIVPTLIQRRLNNVSRFAATPKRLFNNLFQFNFKGGITEFTRLVLNASVGVAGFFDPADYFFDLEEQNTDFDRTLSKYGVGKGAYLIIPIFGPSTVRGVLASGVDHFLSPFTWFGIYDVEEEIAFRSFNITKRINIYSYKLQDMYDRMTENAIDPYIAVQNAYIQHLDKNIRDPFAFDDNDTPYRQ